MYNPYALNGKWILITGASSGIGEACAQVCSKLGANIILTGRNEEQLIRVHQSLDRQEDHFVTTFDFSTPENIPNWIEGVIAKKGLKLDGLVHSAGIDKLSPIRSIDISSINTLTNINFISSVMLLKSCMNRKVSNDDSSFVLISSIAGSVGSPGNAIYGANKAAINSLIKSLARELSPRIRVNGIAPGIVNTPLTISMPEEYNKQLLLNHPLGMGEPEDIAFAASYLLSRAAKWITGTVITVDGGFSS